MTPLVSVIVPARNEEVDIAGALRSIAAQDYPTNRIEVVVVDGDSHDATASVSQEVLATLELARFGVIPNPGGNTPSNLNVGLAWAQGDYVVRVDSRSRIPIDYVRRTVDVLTKRPDVAATGGSQVAVARNELLVNRAITMALNNPWAMGGSRYRRGAGSGPADTVYLGVFRRSQLESIGGWNEHFSTNQDFELNRRMSELGEVWFEAGLPVSYIPRKSVRELFWQYHRFGRWKAHYWNVRGESPQRRQLGLLAAAPLVALAGAGIVWAVRRSLFRAAMGAVLAAAVGPRRGLGWLINGVIGAGWWSGVVRGLWRDDVS